MTLICTTLKSLKYVVCRLIRLKSLCSYPRSVLKNSSLVLKSPKIGLHNSLVLEPANGDNDTITHLSPNLAA